LEKPRLQGGTRKRGSHNLRTQWKRQAAAPTD
jgi:hypothetical protein